MTSVYKLRSVSAQTGWVTFKFYTFS